MSLEGNYGNESSEQTSSSSEAGATHSSVSESVMSSESAMSNGMEQSADRAEETSLHGTESDAFSFSDGEWERVSMNSSEESQAFSFSDEEWKSVSIHNDLDDKESKSDNGEAKDNLDKSEDTVEGEDDANSRIENRKRADEVPRNIDKTIGAERTDNTKQSENVKSVEGIDNRNFKTHDPEKFPEINSVSDYMNAHNYGKDDFDTYSQDPQWRQLMRKEYPDYELPEISRGKAYTQLSQYMNEHNYGREDYAEYSKDPIWRELHSTAFPDAELPPLTGEKATGELTGYDNEASEVQEIIQEENEKDDKAEDIEGLEESDENDKKAAEVEKAIFEHVMEENKPLDELTEAEKNALIGHSLRNAVEQHSPKTSEERIEEIRSQIKIVDLQTTMQENGIDDPDYAKYIQGYYDAGGGIRINSEAYGSETQEAAVTIDHEVIHMLAQRYDANGDVLPGETGLKRHDINSRNTGMNEGATEMYAADDMKEYTPGRVESSYTREVGIMTKYRDLIGKEAMHTAYFESGTYDLMQDYDKHMGEGEFDKFCKEMDEMHRAENESGDKQLADRYYADLESKLNQYQRKRGNEK